LLSLIAEVVEPNIFTVEYLNHNQPHTPQNKAQ